MVDLPPAWLRALVLEMASLYGVQGASTSAVVEQGSGSTGANHEVGACWMSAYGEQQRKV